MEDEADDMVTQDGIRVVVQVKHVDSKTIADVTESQGEKVGRVEVR